MRGKTVEASGYPRSTIEHLIDEWIFSQRDRAVLKRRLLDGVIFEDLSAEFDMSYNRILYNDTKDARWVHCPRASFVLC